MDSHIFSIIERDVRKRKEFRKHIYYFIFLSLFVATFSSFCIGYRTISENAIFLVSSFVLTGFLYCFFNFYRLSVTFSYLISLTIILILIFGKSIYINFFLGSDAFFLYSKEGYHHIKNCLEIGLGISLVLILSFWLYFKKTDLLPTPRIQIATAILSSGCGLLAQSLYCPYLSLQHLFLAHALQAFMSILFMTLLNQRFLKINALKIRKKNFVSNLF